MTTNDGKTDNGENDNDEKQKWTSEFIQKQTHWRRRSRKETKAAVSVLSLAISRRSKRRLPRKLFNAHKLVDSKKVR